MEQKQFKDLGLNDKVPVELQVAVVIQALAEYASSDWSAPAVSVLMSCLQESVLDPVFLREKLAEMQHARDQQEAVMNKFMPGMGLPGLFPFPEEGPQE